MRRKITENLEIDLESEVWCCSRCNHILGSARENYKHFCLVYERDPATIHNPYTTDPRPEFYSLAPDGDWCRIIEFYCPNCGRIIELEYLPIGHPITYDIELDIDSLKRKSE